MPIVFPEFDSFPGSETVLLGGDFCPVGCYAQRLLEGRPIFDAALLQLFKGDYTLINLEAPLCDATLPTASPGGSGLRGDPRLAVSLREMGIDLCGLANNHIRDYRSAGVLETLGHLHAQGIRTVGAGSNREEAETPVEVRLGNLRVGIWALAEKELNLAGMDRAGSGWFDPERNRAAIPVFREKFDFLIVYLHAGHEFTTVPSPRIRRIYRAFIDAGADAVIGHHPHVAQGIERYRDGLIAYSLGNLVFDTPYIAAHSETDIGYLLRLSFGRHRIGRVELIPYRLEKRGEVVALTQQEEDDFRIRMEALSGLLEDEALHRLHWEANVRFRFEQEYRRVLTHMSGYFADREHLDFPRRTRNLFTCPTHVEMLEAIFFLMDRREDPLSRFGEGEPSPDPWYLIKNNLVEVAK